MADTVKHLLRQRIGVQMRQYIRIAALLLAFAPFNPLSPVAVSSAAAFGDKCHRDVRVTGAVRSSMAGAREAAIGAWQGEVARRHGGRFADWYYSADRTFQCSWDATGTRIRCVAIAVPCGRVR